MPILISGFTIVVGLKNKNADNIRLVSIRINTTHPPSINVDINVLQLPNSDDITSITKMQLISSEQQDTSIKPVYQF